jgi:hypothetical protein
MPVARQSAAVREALRLHPVVALIGARGTGKTLVAESVAEQLESRDVQVVRLDAGLTDGPHSLNLPIAAALGCTETDLSAEEMDANLVIRIIVDNCHEFHTRPWWPYLQEQWRALVSTPAARGRVGLLLAGRPLFRHVAGGSGSPLLNIGTTMLVRPLEEHDVVEEMAAEPQVARALLRKTGGHPRLTAMLTEAFDGDLSHLGATVDGFAEQNQRYLMRLAEDHTMGGLAMLADLVVADSPVAEAALTNAHFGGSYADAQETLADLAASGLIARDGGTCAIAAELLKRAPAVRTFLRAPAPQVPINAPDRHGDAAALFYVLENQLREMIVEALGAVDRAWWQTRVPPNLIGEAESRRTAEFESAATPTGEGHPIMFLSLGELFDIVLAADNWGQVFGIRIRRSADVARAASRDLIAVRNKIAHNRPVSAADLDLAQNAAQRLGIEPTRRDP